MNRRKYSQKTTDAESDSFPKVNKSESNQGLLVRPQLMLSAERKHLFAAVILFFIAKNANAHGWITKEELKERACALGMSKSQFYRGLNDAVDLFFRAETTSTGKYLYRVISYEKAYEIMECPTVDAHAVFIPANYLFERGISFVARTKAEFQNKPISQDKMRQITGVPQSTQRRLNKKHGVLRKRNIAVTQYDGSLIYGLREMGQKNVFVYEGKIAKHIPSQSNVTKRSLIVVPLCKRKVRSLRKNLVVSPLLSGETSQFARLFCNTNAEREQAAKRYRKSRLHIEGNFKKLHVKNKSFGVWDYSVVQ